MANSISVADGTRLTMRTPGAYDGAMADVPAGWRLDDDALVRDLELADFAAAMAYVNRVAEVAEARNHHPDILVHGWNKVRLTLSTHSAGGLTDADFALAAALPTP
jgi:4a-hydroxytetrahydrobiopterin dehydratase